MIVAKHCVRSINILMIVDVNFLHFIHSFISFNENEIAHNNTHTDITVSINNIVSITIVPIIPPLFFLFLIKISYLSLKSFSITRISSPILSLASLNAN